MASTTFYVPQFDKKMDRRISEAISATKLLNVIKESGR